MKLAYCLGFLLGLFGCGNRSGSNLTLAKRVDAYACYLAGAEKSVVSLRETDQVVSVRPDGTEVRTVIFEISGRSIKGTGRVHASAIDAAALDPLQGDIQLKAKMQNGLMQGRVAMLGDVKDIRCFVVYDNASKPEGRN